MARTPRRVGPPTCSPARLPRPIGSRSGSARPPDLRNSRGPARRLPGRGEQSPMEASPVTFEGMDVAVLSRIVIPFMMVNREEIAGVRGLSREFCEVPFPAGARVVQTEKPEGAGIVLYVERVEAI